MVYRGHRRQVGADELNQPWGPDSGDGVVVAGQDPLQRLGRGGRVDCLDSLQASRWWPALVTAVDHALQRGWRLDDLLGAAGIPKAGSVDAAQALAWRISLLADPMSTDEPGEPPSNAVPSDPWNNAEPPSVEIVFGARDDITARPARTADAVFGGPPDQDWVEPDLAVAGLVRRVAGPPEQSDADVQRMFTRAMAWQECPISRDRMIDINQMALSYFRSQFPSSWGHQYLADRFGQDLTDDVRFRPGQAPVGWTALISHLRSNGVTGEEMTTAGVATVASTGRLIDRFRDRVMFPIIHNREILGFVGRRHPISPTPTAAARSTSTPRALPCSTKELNSSAPTRWMLPPVASR
jgi:hypothetical protein